MSVWQLPREAATLFAPLVLALDRRQHRRFARLVAGLLFAHGRRTVTAWFRAGGLSHQFRAGYNLVDRIGRRAARLATELLVRVLLPRLAAGQDRLLFGLDDSPTKRYGRRVQGAGRHHNPTPGPSQQQFLYGHVWVTLAWLARHPRWGAIALPLRAGLYIRRGDVAKLPKGSDWTFRTKLALAAELIQWLAFWTQKWGRALWLVCDGAYAKREVLKAARLGCVTLVSRLRKDAALRTLPPPRAKGQRGRRRLYGLQRIRLAKRAGQKRGWSHGWFRLYGQLTRKRYKTFLATWVPAGGVIRVVLVREARGAWRAYFCTKAEASVADILEAVADRFSIEQCFHDVKEIWAPASSRCVSCGPASGHFT